MSRSRTPGVAEQWATTQHELLTEVLAQEFNGDQHGLQFVRLSATEIDRPARVPVFWSPVPRQAVESLGRDDARLLCDWTPLEEPGQPYRTMRGGRKFHTEYCEYAVVLDPAGVPKRVEVTTELREWWLCLARHAPEQLRAQAADVLGTAVSYEELYGELDPVAVTDPARRGAAFERQVAGPEVSGPPPQGRLNRDHALFMSVPINGLDDVYYILLLAARRYAREGRESRESREGREVPGGPDRPAPLPWALLDNPYFRDPKDRGRLAALPHLYGTNADPSLLRAVQLAAWDNRTVAVDPLAAVLSQEDFPADRLVAPQRWVRWSRPAGPGLYQRLVIGPGDDEPETLADVAVRDVSGALTPLTGGFQLLELLSVGVMLAMSPPGTVAVAADPVARPRHQIQTSAPGDRARFVAALERARAERTCRTNRTATGSVATGTGLSHHTTGGADAMSTNHTRRTTSEPAVEETRRTTSEPVVEQTRRTTGEATPELTRRTTLVTDEDPEPDPDPDSTRRLTDTDDPEPTPDPDSTRRTTNDPTPAEGSTQGIRR